MIWHRTSSRINSPSSCQKCVFGRWPDWKWVAADNLLVGCHFNESRRESESFIPGTNFSAWVHRIMINHFISALRRARETMDIEQMPEIGHQYSAAGWRADLREVSRGFQRLPEDQKHALRSIAIEEKSYEQVAGESGVAVGTLKSRVPWRPFAATNANDGHGENSGVMRSNTNRSNPLGGEATAILISINLPSGMVLLQTRRTA